MGLWVVAGKWRNSVAACNGNSGKMELMRSGAEASGPVMEAAAALLAARHGKSESLSVARGDGAMSAGMKRPRNQSQSEAAPAAARPAMQRQYTPTAREGSAGGWRAVYSAGEVQPLPLEACGELVALRQQSLFPVHQQQQRLPRMAPYANAQPMPLQQARPTQHWPNQNHILSHVQHTPQARDASSNQFPKQQYPPRSVYTQQPQQSNPRLAGVGQQYQYHDRQSTHFPEQHQQQRPKQKRQNPSKRKNETSTKARSVKTTQMSQHAQQQGDDGLVRRTSVILPGQSIVPPPYQRKPNLIEADPRLVAVPPVRMKQEAWRQPSRERLFAGLTSGSGIRGCQEFGVQSSQTSQSRDVQWPEGINVGFHRAQHPQPLTCDRHSDDRSRHQPDAAPIHHHHRERHDRIQDPQSLFSDGFTYQPSPHSRTDKFGDEIWSNQEHTSHSAQAVDPSFPLIVSTTTLQYSQPGDVQVFSALPSLQFRSNCSGNDLSSLLNPVTSSSAEEDGEDFVDGFLPRPIQQDGTSRETVPLFAIGLEHNKCNAESSTDTAKSSQLALTIKSPKPLSNNRLRKLEKKSKRQERKRNSLAKKSGTVSQGGSSTLELPVTSHPAEPLPHLTSLNKPTAQSDGPRVTTKGSRSTKTQKRKQEVDNPKLDSYPGDQLKRQQEQMFRQARIAMLAKQQRPGHVEVSVFTRPLPIIAPRIAVTPDISLHLGEREIKRIRVQSPLIPEVQNAEEPALPANRIANKPSTHPPLPSQPQPVFLPHLLQHQGDANTRVSGLDQLLHGNFPSCSPHSRDEPPTLHAMPMPSPVEHKLLLAAASHYSEKTISDHSHRAQVIHEEETNNSPTVSGRKKGKPRKQRGNKASTVSPACDDESASPPEAASSNSVHDLALTTSCAVSRPQPETVMIFCKRDFLRFQAGRLWRKYQEIKRKRDQAHATVTGRRARYLNPRYQSGSQSKPSVDLRSLQQENNKRARLTPGDSACATDRDVVEISDDEETAEGFEPHTPALCNQSPTLAHLSTNSESDVNQELKDGFGACEIAHRTRSAHAESEDIHTRVSDCSSDATSGCPRTNAESDGREPKNESVAPEEEVSIETIDYIDAQSSREHDSLTNANVGTEGSSDYDWVISATLEDILCKIEASWLDTVNNDASRDERSGLVCVVGAANEVQTRVRLDSSCGLCNDESSLQCEAAGRSKVNKTDEETTKGNIMNDDSTPDNPSTYGANMGPRSPRVTTSGGNVSSLSTTSDVRDANGIATIVTAPATTCDEETFVIIEEDTFGNWPETPIQTRADRMADSEVTPDESERCATVCDGEGVNNQSADSNEKRKAHEYEDALRHVDEAVSTGMDLEINQ